MTGPVRDVLVVTRGSHEQPRLRRQSSLAPSITVALTALPCVCLQEFLKLPQKVLK